jgi:hypothetical protein
VTLSRRALLLHSFPALSRPKYRSLLFLVADVVLLVHVCLQMAAARILPAGVVSTLFVTIGNHASGEKSGDLDCRHSFVYSTSPDLCNSTEEQIWGRYHW